MSYLNNLCLTEFQHWLWVRKNSRRQRRTRKPNFNKYSESKKEWWTSIHCRGHVANEEIALDKTWQGETSKKCFLPINSISAPVIFQRLIISGELCYISPPTVFPAPVVPANILYCWDDRLLFCVSPSFSSLSPSAPVPVRSREMPPIQVVSIWDFHFTPLNGKRN